MCSLFKEALRNWTDLSLISTSNLALFNRNRTQEFIVNLSITSDHNSTKYLPHQTSNSILISITNLDYSTDSN